ncbi:nucleoside 2-deoxyribosyltransferase [Roseobacter phage RD-1410W1-01]|uniref:DUF4406 domain-containing protein n=1 Tax=Roseobacter phage RD-1410W1-01 TaxID=1815984 RepID=A0A191VYF3_9CAUD|nr:nucleoside 2-deoxyribosyltransferase [Roseobacter phage RD-1410W1-01]ANJ20741.1 hypothetical protein RDp01_gp07 [Roseobacter phage RD-1410W1-01]
MTEETKVYIAGPMSGIPEYNRPAFMAAKQMFLDRGFPVDCIFNPIESEMSEMTQKGMFRDTQEAYRHCLAMDLEWICKEATLMYFLEGWERSPGARSEHATAVAIGIPIEYQS